MIIGELLETIFSVAFQIKVYQFSLVFTSKHDIYIYNGVPLQEASPNIYLYYFFIEKALHYQACLSQYNSAFVAPLCFRNHE